MEDHNVTDGVANLGGETGERDGDKYDSSDD
jgi:hypothetical protein